MRTVTVVHMLRLSTELSRYHMAGVITDHTCHSTIATADETKMAASLAVKIKGILFHFNCYS